MKNCNYNSKKISSIENSLIEIKKETYFSQINDDNDDNEDDDWLYDDDEDYFHNNDLHEIEDNYGGFEFDNFD